MPQEHRFFGGLVTVEYEEALSGPHAERFTLAVAGRGTLHIVLNGQALALEAPFALCLSPHDRAEYAPGFACKAFHFHPSFVNSKITCAQVQQFSAIEDQHDMNLMQLFVRRAPDYRGYLSLPAATWLQLDGWLDTIGGQLAAQPDGYWTCRSRRYLLQTLYLLEELRDTPNRLRDPVQLAVEYMHIHYGNGEITLADISRAAGLNRTSLNQRMRTQYGKTVMEYLQAHRLEIACHTLKLTNLTIDEIAMATGFKYGSYFTRRFTMAFGATPTAWREAVWTRLGLRGREQSGA